jgi:hypothetical protein
MIRGPKLVIRGPERVTRGPKRVARGPKRMTRGPKRGNICLTVTCFAEASGALNAAIRQHGVGKVTAQSPLDRKPHDRTVCTARFREE